jgi:hypothetical protein
MSKSQLNPCIFMYNKIIFHKKKISSQKRAGGVAQGVDPVFKPQFHKNKTLPLSKWKNALTHQDEHVLLGICLYEGMSVNICRRIRKWVCHGG